MKTAVVVTSISAPNAVLRSISQGSSERGWSFLVVGDRKSPPEFQLDGARFYSLAKQSSLDFELAKICPEGHYCRKNLGYLLALSEGADRIIETDDDNFPRDSFWESRHPSRAVNTISGNGWCNVYSLFTDRTIWPRGFPLNLVRSTEQSWLLSDTTRISNSPIQQGLADDNPDVDAIYRMLFELPITFDEKPDIALEKNVWCPFNSQNTCWYQPAFPLLYLPATCSFRMTDIWRSFVAQRVAWECGWSILFHAPSVYQERNEHDLHRDFVDEMCGYEHNQRMCDALNELSLKPGIEHIQNNLYRCYELLVNENYLDARELVLLSTWLNDINNYVSIG